MTLEERFWSKVDRSGGPDACWPWLAGCDRVAGYGVFWLNRRPVKAHKVALKLSGRPVPPGKLGLHHCDNRPCCNPAHLYHGTHKNNATDRSARGRANSPRGEAHGGAKLNVAQVLAIRRELRAKFRTYADTARAYGVTAMTIFHIGSRKKWGHIPEAA